MGTSNIQEGTPLGARNIPAVIQIVDTHELLETRIGIGFAAYHH